MAISFAKLRHLAKQVIEPSLVGSGNLIANVIGALLWFTLASLMVAEDYGLVNYYIAIASVASTVSLLGLNTTIMTFLPKGNETILRQASTLALVTSAAASIVVAIAINDISTAFLLIGLSAFTLTIAESLGRKKFKRYSMLMIACRGSQFVLAIALYQVMGTSGVIVGYAIPSIFLGYRLFALQKFAPSLTEIRSRSSFIGHSYSLSLSQSATAYADKLLIAPLFGFATLGVYQLGFQFLLFLTVIPSSLLQYLIPQEASGKENKSVKKIGVVLSVALALLSFITIPAVISTLFPRYSDAIPIAQVMAFGIVPLTINALLNAKFLGRENSRPVLTGSLVYVGSLAVTLVILGSYLGNMGLAISMLGSLSLQTLVLWMFDKKGKVSIPVTRSGSPV